MSTITPTLLNDTLSLIQLARETALVQGKQDQAQRLSPVVNEMRSLVSSAQSAQAAKPSAATGVMAQSDFRTLLEAARGGSGVTSVPSHAAQAASSGSGVERIDMIKAMAAGNMTDVDIARQMGMTRDEVRLVLSVGQKNRPAPEVTK